MIKDAAYIVLAPSLDVGLPSFYRVFFSFFFFLCFPTGMVNFLSDCVCVCGQSLLQDPGLRRRLLLAISHGGLRPGLDRGAPLDQRNAHQSAVLRRPRNAGSVHVNHRFSFVFCFVWFCFCFFTEKCPNAGASC